MQKQLLLVVLIMIYTLSLVPVVIAEDYPAKNLNIILPFKAGGGTDTSMRLLQKPLEERLGKRLNFIYKPGAGGVLGYMAIIKGTTDGYNIGAVNWPHVLVPTIVKDNPGYNLEGIEPVATYNKDVAVMGVHKDSSWKNLKDLIDDAKKRPEMISVAHPVRLGYSLRAAYEFEEITGAKLKNVFFDGGAASKQAFLGKHVDVWVINGSVMRKVKKEVRPLAVMGANRVSYFPDTPTFSELGYPIEVYTYRAIVTKSGTDLKKIEILSKAIQDAVADKDFQKAMRKKGVEPFSLNAQELADFSKKSYGRIKDLYLKYEKKF